MRDRRRLAWVTLAGGALVPAFWALYFAGAVPQSPFEASFVAADALLAAALFGATRALRRGTPEGPFLLVAAAGMCLYLGIVDVTFYARHGLYSRFSGAAMLELAVNTLCIGGGLYGLRAGWRLWRHG